MPCLCSLVYGGHKHMARLACAASRANVEITGYVQDVAAVFTRAQSTFALRMAVARGSLLQAMAAAVRLSRRTSGLRV